MAKTPTRSRKRVKQQVADGMAHVHASFNNTIIPLLTARVTHLRGLLLVVQVSVVHGSQRRSQHRLLQSVQVKWRQAYGLKTWKYL